MNGHARFLAMKIFVRLAFFAIEPAHKQLHVSIIYSIPFRMKEHRFRGDIMGFFFFFCRS